MNEWWESYLDEDDGDPEDFDLDTWFKMKYGWLCRDSEDSRSTMTR